MVKKIFCDICGKDLETIDGSSESVYLVKVLVFKETQK